MSLLLPWLVFPALSLLVLWGCGLLVSRLSGDRPPFGVLLGLGLCAVIVVASLASQMDVTAELATPAIVLLALAGFVLERRSLSPGLSPWAIAAVFGVFCVYAAPVVLSGEPTFGGYSVLGDTAVHFLASDQLLSDGYDVSALPASEFRNAIESYFVATAYPAGAQLGAAALRNLVGIDIAWVFQPYLALLCALMAAAMWSLVRPWVPKRWMRALVVFVAAQPALLYAYVLQGSIKEIAAVWIIVLVAALLPEWRRTCRSGVRRAIPLAVATAGALNILSVSILPWLAPLLAIGLGMAIWGARLRGRALAGSVALFTVVAAALAVPALRVLGSFVETTTDVVTGQTEFGNLLRALNPLQSAGIWLNGDFRLPPAGNDLLWTYALLGIAAVALVAAIVWVFEERRWLVLGLAGTMLIAWLYVTHRGSPWADAKALAITAPMLLLGVMLGAAALQRRLPVVGLALAGVIAGGVLVSNALVYHAAVLAPYDRLSELESVGERYAGRGPATTLDADDFTKHFLREAVPAGPGAQSDIDSLPADVVQSRPLIVRRRSATASRPPSNYELGWRGKYYEVWERAKDGPQVLRHVPLGDGSSQVAAAPCGAVRELAAHARREGARLVAATGTAPATFRVAGLPPPAGWGVDVNEPETLSTVGPGALRGWLAVPRAGRYDVWLEGSFGRPVEVRIDGRRVASVRDRTNYRGQSERAGVVSLSPGRHGVEIIRAGGDLRPGSGGTAWRVGRLWLTPQPGGAKLVDVAPARARALCGRQLDWLEIVR